MTSRQFRERMLRDHHLRTVGATRCPPGTAAGDLPPVIRSRRSGKGRAALQVAVRISVHYRDEATGEPVPKPQTPYDNRR